MFLMRMEISRFKCIDYIDYRFERRASFLVFAGMNGVGKSCIIEAIGFALGVTLNELRVNDLNGLIPQGFTALKKRTFCNLTFTSVDNANNNSRSDVIIGSYVDDDSVRCYNLNHKKVSKAEFDTHLETLNISKSSGFYISQNHIHSIMAASPKDLYKSILFASNVGIIQEEQHKIEKLICSYEVSNNLILTALNKIKEKIEKDQIKITIIERNVKITIEMDSIGLEIVELESLHYYYSSYNILYELRNLLSCISRYNQHLLELSKSIDLDNNTVSDTTKAALEYEATSEEIQNVVRSINIISNNIHNNAMESDFNTANIDNIILESNNLRLECCKFKTQFLVIQEKLDNLVNEINNGVNNCDSITSIISDRKSEIQNLYSTKSNIEYLIMSYTDVAMTSLANEHEILSENQQVLQLMKRLKRNEHDLLVTICDDENEIEFTSSNESLIDCKLESISKKLSEVGLRYNSVNSILNGKIQSLQAIQSQLRLPNLFLIDNDTFIGDDFGYFADIISLTNDSNAKKFKVALNFILEPFLSVRIVSDSIVASKIVHKAQDETRISNSITRIWPLDKLIEVPTLSDLNRPKYYKELLQNKSFVDPTTLIGINNRHFNYHSNISKVVTKALGSYILCDNDVDATNAIAKYQSKNKMMSIVTIDGVIHRPGLLYLSDITCADICYDKLGLLEAYQKALFELDEAKTLCGTIKTQLQNDKLKVLHLVKLKDIISEIKVTSHQISVSYDNVSSSTTRRIQDATQRDAMIFKLENINGNIKRSQQELEHICKCAQDGVQEHLLIALHVEYQRSLQHSNNETKRDLEQQLLTLELKRLETCNLLECFENQLEVYKEKQNCLARVNKDIMETKIGLVLKEQTLQQKFMLMTKLLDVKMIPDNNTVDMLHEKRLSYQHKLQQLYSDDLFSLIQRYKCLVNSAVTMKHPRADDSVHLSQLEFFDLMLHFQKEISHNSINSHNDDDSKKNVYQNAERLVDIASEMMTSLASQVGNGIISNQDDITLPFLPCDVDGCLSNLATKRELLQLLKDEYISNSTSNKLQDKLGFSHYHHSRYHTIKKTTPKRKRNSKQQNDNGECDDSIIIDEYIADDKQILESLQMSISRDRATYLDLRVKFDNVTNAILQLSNGIKTIADVISLKLSNTFQAIRSRVITYFHDLVPNKQCDLIQIDFSDLSVGVKFVLVESNVSNSSISELSGGQKGLLSLSFVFALCNLRSSPLYLLDEVDAALDIGNQEMVAKVIAKFFKNSLVLCVSHHAAMQVQSDSLINVQLTNGRTVIL